MLFKPVAAGEVAAPRGAHGRLVALVVGMIAIGLLALTGRGTLAALFVQTTNASSTISTSQLYSPTGLSGSRSGATNVLTWTAASPMNGNGYAISGVNNGASSACPATAAAYTTFVGSTAAVTFTDSGPLAGGAAGTYVCYLVQSGYQPAGVPPWAGIPVWTSIDTLPTTAVLLPSGAIVPALVQSNQNSDVTGGATTLSATWTSATTAGNLLVAAVGVPITGAQTVTMPAGWLAGPATDNPANGTARIFYYPNAPSFPAASTVTATINPAANVALIISEWSGVLGVSPLDATGGATGATATATVSTTGATVQTGELSVAAVFDADQTAVTFVPGAGWTEVINTGASAGAALDLIYQIKATAAIATATDSWTTAFAYAASIATFKHA